MPLVVACPSCKAKVNAPEDAIGKTVPCPSCTAAIEVVAPLDAIQVGPGHRTDGLDHRERHFADDEDRPSRKDLRHGGVRDSARTMAMLIWLIHLVSAIFAVIFFLIKRKESRFIDWHGKQSLNLILTHYLAIFTISLLGGAGAIAGEHFNMPLLSIIACGVSIVLIISILTFGLVLKIIAALKANSGERWEPPLCFRFFK